MPDRPYLANVIGGVARPKGLAHRGYAPDGAENSLAAVQAAVDLGCGWVETDVQASADGELFVFHDDTLERVTGTTGRISTMTAAAVRAVRIGTDPIPTLAEVLERFPDLRLNIDVKSRVGVAPLAAVIDRLGAHDRVLVASFSDRRRRAVLRRLSRPAATSAGTALTAVWVLASVLPLLAPAARRLLRDVDAFQVPERQRMLGVAVPVVTARSVALAHRWGLEVHVWTINDADAMRRLLDAGADGIVSDRADVLAAVLTERGAWPQA
ncbi:glycerophosphoryl diester phosphodiesterase [Tersicoccus solisilvae]|uniref:Glycerophosphoryl diester phosphodiesterase n=1 Tax=Tersicoccus solisilvae TaxID=1882339 RepID=A0ABQ1NIL7_9MICC|nr:glycerophosphodiester phosphodiesterase family protein [Tersicoccus solisilvae]GGC77739.1 glycerophosphoryl diester phosphodiesterase [Tersicoccus solisilvae]